MEVLEEVGTIMYKTSDIKEIIFSVIVIISLLRNLVVLLYVEMVYI